MSDDGFHIFTFFLGLVLGGFVAGGIGCTGGQGAGIRMIRTEAVQQGYAEWVPDEAGQTEFRWKEAE